MRSVRFLAALSFVVVVGSVGTAEAAGGLFGFGKSSEKEDASADKARDLWMPGYSKMEEAKKVEQQGNRLAAKDLYKQALAHFREVAEKFPQWQSDLVSYRIVYCENQIERLSALEPDPNMSKVELQSLVKEAEEEAAKARQAFEAERQKLEEQIRQLRAELGDCSDARMKTAIEAQALQEELAAARERLAALEQGEEWNAEKKLEQLQARLAAREAKIADLNEQVQELKKRKKQPESADTGEGTGAETEDPLLAENQSLKEEMAELQNVLEQCKASRRSKAMEARVALNELEDVKAKLAEAQAGNGEPGEPNAKIEELNNKLRERDRQIAQLQQQVADLQAETERLRNDVEDQPADEGEEQDGLREELDDLRAEKRELQAKLDERTGEIGDCQEAREQAEKKAQTAEEELKNLRDDVAAKNEQLEDLNQEQADLKRKVAMLELAVDRARKGEPEAAEDQDVLHLQERIDELKAELLRVQEEMQKQAQALEDAKAAKQKAEEEAENLRNELQETKDALAAAEEDAGGDEQLRKRVAELREDIEERDAKIAELEEQNKNLEEQVESGTGEQPAAGGDELTEILYLEIDKLKKQLQECKDAQ